MKKSFGLTPLHGGPQIAVFHLRTVIFGLLIAETQARMNDKDAGAIKAAQASQLLSEEKHFLYQKWNASIQKLEADKDKQGLPANAVMATLPELRKLCRGDVITKFNANRRMKREPEDNDKAVFVVEVSLRSSSFSTPYLGFRVRV